MDRPQFTLLSYLILILILMTGASNASANGPLSTLEHRKVTQPTPFNPVPPHIAANAFITVDIDSGKVLAQKDVNKKLPPASLTKIMTLYVVSSAIKSGQIKLSDKVRVSQKAWQTPGSKMFIKEGQTVTIENLIKGVIVASGNDASVALAEYIAGSEKNFVNLMNQHAKQLGMTHSHFTDSTGLPNKNLVTTAKDMAILARAIVKDFPQFYHWYGQKWFTFNGIKQPNRNRLLWRMSSVDGLKTGHTKEAGFCLVATAKKHGMHLLTVVLGAPSDAARADGGQRLISYGFRFYETHALFKPLSPIAQAPLWKGNLSKINVGLETPLYVTISKGQYDQLEVLTEMQKHIQAPIQKGQPVGTLVVKFHDKTIAERPLISLDSAKRGGFFTRVKDGLGLSLKKIAG